MLSNGSPDEAHARVRQVYVGRECPCGGDEECQSCDGTGDIGSLVTLAAFRVTVGITATTSLVSYGSDGLPGDDPV